MEAFIDTTNFAGFAILMVTLLVIAAAAIGRNRYPNSFTGHDYMAEHRGYSARAEQEQYRQLLNAEIERRRLAGTIGAMKFILGVVLLLFFWYALNGRSPKNGLSGVEPNTPSLHDRTSKQEASLYQYSSLSGSSVRRVNIAPQRDTEEAEALVVTMADYTPQEYMGAEQKADQIILQDYLQVSVASKQDDLPSVQRKYEARFPGRVQVARSRQEEPFPYKVLIGPFASKEEALSARMQEGQHWRNLEEHELDLIPVVQE